MASATTSSSSPARSTPMPMPAPTHAAVRRASSPWPPMAARLAADLAVPGRRRTHRADRLPAAVPRPAGGCGRSVHALRTAAAAQAWNRHHRYRHDRGRASSRRLAGRCRDPWRGRLFRAARRRGSAGVGCPARLSRYRGGGGRPAGAGRARLHAQPPASGHGRSCTAGRQARGLREAAGNHAGRRAGAGRTGQLERAGRHGSLRLPLPPGGAGSTRAHRRRRHRPPAPHPWQLSAGLAAGPGQQQLARRSGAGRRFACVRRHRFALV
ncbi:hypothetical protein G6F59_013553 [Rhizopus arrhizus]|nr:hypothetical protein G6F59_013553 [Rhizopus arrhizus]